MFDLNVALQAFAERMQKTASPAVPDARTAVGGVCVKLAYEHLRQERIQRALQDLRRAG